MKRISADAPIMSTMTTAPVYVSKVFSGDPRILTMGCSLEKMMCEARYLTTIGYTQLYCALCVGDSNVTLCAGLQIEFGLA